MQNKLTYKPFGEKAILIEWNPKISETILEDILLFQSKIKKEQNADIADFIVAYNSLTIVYKKDFINFDAEVNSLKKIQQLEIKIPKKQYYIWEIPVCYDGIFGVDLQEMSKKLDLEISEIIQLHTATLYKIYFIGFLPGFLYLGGLHKKLFIDRKANPRLKVAKGSVAIGGKQTGIYPTETAGGWHLIGNSPVLFFDISKENPCFGKSGDFIKFTPVSLSEYHQIVKDIKEKKYIISKTLYND